MITFGIVPPDDDAAALADARADQFFFIAVHRLGALTRENHCASVTGYMRVQIRRRKKASSESVEVSAAE